MHSSFQSYHHRGQWKFRYLLLSLFLSISIFHSCDSSSQSDKQAKSSPLEEENTALNRTDQEPQLPVTTDHPKNKTEEQSSSSDSIRSNQFETVINSLEPIDYQLKKFEILHKEKNFLNPRIEIVNKYKALQKKALLDLVAISGLLQVRRAFIKGTKDLGNRLYTRAEVESWEMKNEAAAISVYQQIEKIKSSHHWEDISKSPITCFRKHNEIVFITPGGFYMLDKVPILADFLKKQL